MIIVIVFLWDSAFHIRVTIERIWTSSVLTNLEKFIMVLKYSCVQYMDMKFTYVDQQLSFITSHH